MRQPIVALLLVLATGLGTAASAADSGKKKKSAHTPARASLHNGAAAEARLIEIYQLIGQGMVRDALPKAESLVRDHPTFQLAQMVHGDLLMAQVRPLQAVGDMPAKLVQAKTPMLAELREESQLRLKALRERPPQGTLPAQFVALSPRNKHAIAIDASRSRLYLFENQAQGLKLIADYYISLGKAGIEKTIEGDLRTPVGVYFITSTLDPKSLSNFYGIGALPINYPNILDAKRGKSGRGIWLHGAPPNQYARAPLATDGCVVLANPDLSHILRTVEVRTTPVVIAPKLAWVPPQNIKLDSKSFEEALAAWRSAKSGGDFNALQTFYAVDFNSNGKGLTEWLLALRGELGKAAGRAIDLKDLSYLRWVDSADTMVVTFGEVPKGTVSGPIKRQYWSKSGNQWKIFYEGIIG